MPAILMDINGDIEDVETHVLEAHVLETNDDSNITSNVKTITEYLLSHKKIPMPHDLPVKLRTDEELPPQTFVPSENVCPLCPGPTPPELNTEIITCKAVVYGIKYIHKGSSVAVKKCPACQNVIRFQEYESGFHNFNNKVFLTMPLCELLLSGLANKTTPGRMLETLTFFNNNTYHHQTIRKAFQHFLALTDFKYEFTCHQCGHNPPIIIADGNWKLAFDIPIGTFKRPEQDSILEEDLEVDITKAWDDLTKALIAEGSLSGTTTNPYKQKLSHSTLAPWMGENTRYGNVLPKTEIKKAMGKKRDTAISKAAQNVNEDTIRELIESKKPLRKDLQDACHALGVSSDGSVTDLIIKLEELLNFRDVYPKLFVKIQKAGGGVLHFSCIHGVVYYMNFLFWKEELAGIRYSLCQMNEDHFKHILRIVIELHNLKINRQFKHEMETLCHTELFIGPQGILGLTSEKNRLGPAKTTPNPAFDQNAGCTDPILGSDIGADPGNFAGSGIDSMILVQ
ncbi:hypothetical protein WMY93_025512 [Mugilogobius chulae]|uniref:HMG domain-containing protein n=1 Tax=Mugilogobius chulae TaxID=88201 RepID=A0AAW0MZI1_9GOBI